MLTDVLWPQLNNTERTGLYFEPDGDMSNTSHEIKTLDSAERRNLNMNNHTNYMNVR